MRIVFTLLILAPFILNAQINRSATELAQENIHDYVVNKVFKDKDYAPVSYGELKPVKQNNAGIVWTIEHKFEIIDRQKETDKSPMDVHHTHRFVFYMDKKMKILTAENIYSPYW
jgi:hypothetical protein